jgi:hypothetical protein
MYIFQQDVATSRTSKVTQEHDISSQYHSIKSNMFDRSNKLRATSNELILANENIRTRGNFVAFNNLLAMSKKSCLVCCGLKGRRFLHGDAVTRYFSSSMDSVG